MATINATYQVDDDEPVWFGVPPTNLADQISNQLFLNVPNLTVGEHKVVVVSNGSSTGPPLAVSYFLVTSLTAAEQASLIPSNNSTNSTNPNLIPPSDSQHHISTNAIVLGVVLPVMLLAAIGILWYRRKMKGQLQEISPFGFPSDVTTNQPVQKALDNKALTLSQTPMAGG